MSCQIITEGEHDRLILERALAASPVTDYQVLSAGGRSAAVSLARSVLATLPNRVALVIDADTSDPTEAAVRRRRAEDALSEVADPSRFLVLVVMPELEGLFFESPESASLLTGRQLSPGELEQFRTHPRESLTHLVGGRDARTLDRPRFVAFLAQLDQRVLSQTHVVRTLVEFLTASDRREATAVAG